MPLSSRALTIVVTNLVATLFIAQVAVVFGLEFGFFALLLMGSVIAGLNRERALAIVLLAVTPLPSVEALLGVPSPAGLDVVNALVLLGVAVAITKGRRFPLLESRAIVLAATLNFVLLLAAWYRGFGDDPDALASITLVLHPVAVFLAAVFVVQLVEPAKAVETVAYGMAGVLFVVGLSVFAQAVGVYTPPGLVPGVKANGGFLLQGNEAAALYSTFAVPAFVLLRSVGRVRLGGLLLLYSLAVVLVTVSRTSLLILPLALVALAVFDRRAQTARVVAGIAVLATFYVGTVGRAQTQEIVRSLTQHSISSNQTLSGRPYIWNKARQFLDEDDNLLVGGGLNSFERYTALDPRLANTGFTTHNVWLRQLVNGGLVMAAGYFFFLLAFWWFSRRSNSAPAIALRVAVLSTVLLGLTKDVNPFDRGGAWLWTLVALAALPAPALGEQRREEPETPLRPKPRRWRGLRVRPSPT